MAPPANIQSVALQLEKVRKNVPTAYEQEHVLLDMIDKRGDVIDASTRNIRLPQLIRPGGKFSQGTADFDDMGRGSGSTWDVGTLSTLQFRFAFEVSKLAEYATKGNDKAVEDVAVREVAEAMKMFKRALDCVYNTNGTGQLDSIAAISGTTLTVANPNIFFFNQDIQVYPTGLASAARGLCTVTAVDPLLKTITVNALPAGTIVGDALVINISQGAGGANPVSLEGLLYNHVDSASGSWNNLARSTYPEALKTPHVAAGGATITPALRRLGENKLRRVLGVDFDEPLVTFMNVDQEAAWENVGITVTTNIQAQISGENSQDMLKRRPPKTFGGIPIKTSIHATIQRIDVIALKHWGRGVTKEVDLFEEGGQTVFQLYGQSGGLLAGYISYFDTVFNVFMDQPRFGIFWDGLALPVGGY
ncbi:MAG TPA: hypothetical protein VHV32_19345 [Candidatus Angelobacter sp.]|jgi:hypothetical protein|nr:hypothetical protein [Candidatus Angelobacter sp.]